MKKIGKKHIDYLTDDFGIWQHTKGKVIDKIHGYALDDAARAGLVALQFNDQKKIVTYKNFVKRSLNLNANFFSPDRFPLRIKCTADATGQSYWFLSRINQLDNFSDVFNKIKKRITKTKSLRGISYSILGALYEDTRFANYLLKKLSFAYRKSTTKKWMWIEPELTYGNAIIPFCFLESAAVLNSDLYLRDGLDMLDFLNNLTGQGKFYLPIGSRGWYRKGNRRALFDQQPIEAAYHILANNKAFEITHDEKYLKQAELAYRWYFGYNIPGLKMIKYDMESIYDGIWPTGLRKNFGAESTICFLLAQEALIKK